MLKKRKYESGCCIYVIGSPKMKNLYKIGKTKNINSRMTTYFTGSPYEYLVYHLSYINSSGQDEEKIMKVAEDTLKLVLQEYRFTEENGGTEWYKCDHLDTIIAEVETVTKFLIDLTKKHLHHVVENKVEDFKFDSDDEIVDRGLRNGVIKVCGECFIIFNMDEFVGELCVFCNQNK